MIGKIMEWIDDIFYMCDTKDMYIDNSNAQDRTVEFLKGFKLRDRLKRSSTKRWKW